MFKNKILYFSLFLLTGCGYFNDLFSYKVMLETVNILVDNNANNNSAVAVDLVVVCDEELNKDIAKLTSAEYFHKKPEIVTGNTDKVLVWHWEVVPGQKLKKLPINFSEFDPINGYIFAYYGNGAVNRVKIPDVKEIKIILSKDRVRVIKVATVED